MAARKKKPQEHKLDMARVLRACDMNDKNFWDNLTDEERKSISFFVLARFLSATNQSTNIDTAHWYLGMTNDLLNVHANELRHHQELLWKLACVVGIGRPVRHPWIAPARPRTKKAPAALTALLKQRYPDYKADEIALMAKLNTIDDFIDLAEQSAWSEKDIKALRKDLTGK